MEDSSLRDQVTSSCNKFLKDAITVAKAHFGQDTIPPSDVEVRVMEPTGQGSWSGKRFTYRDMDTVSLRDFESIKLKPMDSFTNTVGAIKSYIDVHHIQTIGPQFQDTEAYIVTQYIIPLFRSYLKEIGHFTYRKRISDKLIKELLEFLDSPVTLPHS